MKIENFRKFCDIASKVCVVMLPPAIIFSVTAAVILFPLAIFFNILAGGLREKLNFIVRNPAAWAFVLIFILALIGVSYSTAPTADILILLRKYSKFLLGIFLLPIFREAKWRNYTINSFLIGAGLLLIASYLRSLGFLGWAVKAGDGVEVFKISMEFSFLMAFAAYVTLVKISSNKKHRYLWVLFFILLVHTTLFRSVGRTGQIVFFALLGWFFIEKLGWRGVLIALISSGVLFSVAYLYSPMFKSRMDQAVLEVKEHSININTSVGIRISFVKNGIRLVKDHPYFGTGTGSYDTEYTGLRPVPQDLEFFNPPNPHNEYLLTAVQFGLVGLFVLLLFFTIPFWCSRHLPFTEKILVRGMIISVMLGAFANNWLMIATLRYNYILFITLAFAAWSMASYKSKLKRGL